MAMIDLILETAIGLGLGNSPRGLAELHRAYLRDHPDATVGRSQNSFDATLNSHVINMRSRFPKPRERRNPAAWLRRPLFKRVAPGQYMLLTDAEVAWFLDAVVRDEPLIYRDEYDVPRTAVAGGPQARAVAVPKAPPLAKPSRKPSAPPAAPPTPIARGGESLDKRLHGWLESHDARLERFEELVSLRELAAETGATERELRARLTDGALPPYYVWPHVHAGNKRHTKPYALRLGAPDAVALDWEESVVAVAEGEFARRGFETRRQLGTEAHLAALLKQASLVGLESGLNLRDLWTLRVHDGRADLWIIEAKGKEAGGFEHYCVAEALGQLFPVPAEPLSELLGSRRGAGHGLCWNFAQRLQAAWQAKGLKVRVTLGLLLPFWGPDVVWGTGGRVSEIAGPCFERPLQALNTFVESGSTDTVTGRYKYERAFGAVLESLDSQCGLRKLARADDGLRFRVLLPTAGRANGFKLLGID